MPNGNLIFIVCDGQSGRGKSCAERLRFANAGMTQLQSNLIDGEKKQMLTGRHVLTKSAIYIFVGLGATPDVSTNHSMCYARSKDGGKLGKSQPEIYIPSYKCR
jgi:hypothetical protein